MLMAEAYGDGIEATNVIGPLNRPIRYYKANQVFQVLLSHLPYNIAIKLANPQEDLVHIVTQFGDADIGTIMQAGAARFLLPEEETSYV